MPADDRDYISVLEVRDAMKLCFAVDDWAYVEDEDGDFTLDFEIPGPDGAGVRCRQLVQLLRYSDAVHAISVSAFYACQVSNEHYWELRDFMNRANGATGVLRYSTSPSGRTLQVGLDLYMGRSVPKFLVGASLREPRDGLNKIVAAVKAVTIDGMTGAQAYESLRA